MTGEKTNNPDDRLIGKTIGGYEILRVLGRGGMGVVYKAHEQSLNRPIALKILPSYLADEGDFLARFKREARAVAQLDHPNIVTVFNIGHEVMDLYDTGQEIEVHYISMQYVKGRELLALIKDRGQVDVMQAMDIARQAASALAAAHQIRIVHRDIKPQNIMVDTMGRVKVMDFGIAKTLGDPAEETPDVNATLTRVGHILGTPSYMSPEQSRGKALDGRSDVYSLGVVLFHMLAGRVPFTGTSHYVILDRILHEDPPPLKSLNRSLPKAALAIVEKAMAKKPEDRYQSAAAMEEDILRFLQTGPRGRPRSMSGTMTATGTVSDTTSTLPSPSMTLPPPPPLPAAPGTGRKLAVALFVFLLVAGSSLAGLEYLGIIDLKGMLGRYLPREGRDNPAGSASPGIPGEIPPRDRIEEDGDRTPVGEHPPRALPTAPPAATAPPAPTSRPEPTPRPEATRSPRPTRSPYPSPTQRPTRTPVPSRTQPPEPTRTNPPSPTPAPFPRLGWIDAPAEGSTIRESRIDVSWRIENDAIAEGFLVGLDDPDPNIRVYNTRANFDLVSEGVHTLTIIPLGSGGERGEAITRRFTYQPNRAPVVSASLDPPTPGDLRARLRASASDPDGGASPRVEYRVDAGAWTPLVGGEAVIDGLAPGTHVVQARATDAEGLQSDFWQESFFIPSPNLPPAIELTSDQNEIGPAEAFRFRTEVSDPERGATRVEYRIDNGPWLDARTPEHEVRDIEAGRHMLEVRAVDDSGSMSSVRSRGFSVRAPALPVTGLTLARTLRHGSYLTSAAISPDGRMAVSAGRHGDGLPVSSVKLWDAQSGRELRTLTAHKKLVQGVAFSPDGTMFASASEDRDIKLWSLPSAAETRSYEGHTSRVQSVAFSPDSSRFVSASKDKTVRLWDARSGHQINLFEGHDRPVICAAYSPRGTHVASGGEDREARVWDLSPDGRVVVFRGHGGWVNGIVFTPDGGACVSASHDTTLRMWETHSGREVRTFQGHRGNVMCIAISPEGSRLLSGGTDNTVRLWDVTSGREVESHDVATNVTAVAFSADGAWCLTAGENSEIRIWSTRR